MVKVVFIADVGLAGGATKSLYELVNTLKNGYSVEPIVLTSQLSSLNEDLSKSGIENYAVGHGAFMQGSPDALWKKPIKWLLFGVKYFLFFYPSLRKAMRLVNWEDVDLIHTNSARVDIGMEISKRIHVPNICHIREFAELDFNCWSYRPRYVKYLDENVDGFIAISNAVKEYWADKGIQKSKITTIYNGVDYKRIKKADHTSWISDKVLRLVIAGGVIPNKGQWQVVEAICRLPDDIISNIRLDIMGGVTEAYKEKISAPLLKRGIVDQVRFLGACSDVYDRLKDYHIGLMCSKAEGFGRVTIEYMHAGLAVIASNTGANPELIEHGINGILYEQTKIESLAEKIETLYRNRDLLIDIAVKGQEYAQSTFTNEINAGKIYQYYLQALKKEDNRNE